MNKWKNRKQQGIRRWNLTTQRNREMHDRPDSKIHGANMGPIWVLSVPDGPHEPCYQGTIEEIIWDPNLNYMSS